MDDWKSLHSTSQNGSGGRIIIYSMLSSAIALMALAVLLANGTLGAPPWLLTMGVGSGALILIFALTAFGLSVGAGLLSYLRYRGR
ncbi:MAG: hypothetical protein P9M14_16195 [Candidatus Alcyoniella australis]|nr:hypothetical protein [Candidatus Alcyoniella australis]